MRSDELPQKGAPEVSGGPFLAFSLANVGQAIAALRAYQWPRELRRMDESVRGWREHYERCLVLLKETREPGDDWPLQRYPEGWFERAHQVLAELGQALEVGFDCHFPERSNSNLRTLAATLRIAAADPASLTGRQVGLARRILLDSEARRGEVGSPQRQRQESRDPEALRARLIARLETLVPESPIDNLELALAPVDGQPVPAPLAERVRRAWRASLPELIQHHVVNSPYDLTKALQVWTELALQQPPEKLDLGATLAVVWTAFPHFEWPQKTLEGWNRLLAHQGRALRLQSSELPPSEDHLQLVRKTIEGSRGTLYHSYFQLPPSAPETTQQLELLCSQRASERFGSEQRLAAVEELILLTSVEQWPLWRELSPSFDPHLSVQALLQWLSREMQRPVHRKYQRWQRHKKLAHTWRRLVFFVSLLDRDGTAEWLRDGFAAPDPMPPALAAALGKLLDGVSSDAPTGWCGEKAFL